MFTVGCSSLLSSSSSSIIKSDETLKPLSSDFSLLNLFGDFKCGDPSLAGSKLKTTVESNLDLLDPVLPPPFIMLEAVLCSLCRLLTCTGAGLLGL